MSGVGVTGLIANLPGTVTPYPTQDPSLELGGFRQVADTTARDAIASQFRAIGMSVVTQNDGQEYRLVGGIANANWVAVASSAPFRGTYYVDPNFTGTQLGSMANPFRTIAAAFAAAVALALSGATVFIPPAVTVTENVVFPDTGGFWEIACVQSMLGSQGTVVGRIVGSVTANSTSAAPTSFGLTNLFLLGNVTGNTSVAACEFFFNNTRQTGTVTLTRSGSATNWITGFKGTAAVSPNKTGGSTTGLVDVAGYILGENWVFEGGFNEAALNTTNPPFDTLLRNCQFGATTGTPVPIGLKGGSLVTYIYDSVFTAAVTFTATNANYVLNVDGPTQNALLRVGVTLVGTNLTLNTINANAPALATIVNNFGAITLATNAPPGLYRADGSQEVLVSGTAGSAVLNVIYTDLTGAVVTKAVTPGLVVTGAPGSESSGSLVFQHKGGAISYSVTGIVTPGPLSIANAISVQRLN